MSMKWLTSVSWDKDIFITFGSDNIMLFITWTCVKLISDQKNVLVGNLEPMCYIFICTSMISGDIKVTWSIWSPPRIFQHYQNSWIVRSNPIHFCLEMIVVKTELKKKRKNGIQIKTKRKFIPVSFHEKCKMSPSNRKKFLIIELLLSYTRCVYETLKVPNFALHHNRGHEGQWFYNFSLLRTYPTQAKSQIFPIWSNISVSILLHLNSANFCMRLTLLSPLN